MFVFTDTGLGSRTLDVGSRRPRPPPRDSAGRRGIRLAAAGRDPPTVPYTCSTFICKCEIAPRFSRPRRHYSSTVLGVGSSLLTVRCQRPAVAKVAPPASMEVPNTSRSITDTTIQMSPDEKYLL